MDQMADTGIVGRMTAALRHQGEMCPHQAVTGRCRQDAVVTVPLSG